MRRLLTLRGPSRRPRSDFCSPLAIRAQNEAVSSSRARRNLDEALNGLSAPVFAMRQDAQHRPVIIAFEKHESTLADARRDLGALLLSRCSLLGGKSS